MARPNREYDSWLLSTIYMLGSLLVFLWLISACRAESYTGVLWTTWACICLVWYLFIWSICLLGLSLARSYFGSPAARSPLSPPNHSGQAPPPGVSILRPLSGLDCNLFTNLCSSFAQDYPLDRFEVILSIKDDTTLQAQRILRVVQKVRSRYPTVRSSIVVGDEEAGVNPKINNLVRSYAVAQYDILWVVDSQVSLPSGALARSVDALIADRQPRPFPGWLHRSPHGARVGLVHHVPLAILPGPSWGSQVERVFLSTTHAKMYLAINSLAIDSCIMGKSNMYRKSDLERVPDAFFSTSKGAIASSAFEPSLGEENTVPSSWRALARFGIYLAEDNMLALSLWREPLGLSHTLARGDVAYTAVGDISSLKDYARRRMRWIRVRKQMVLAATLLEPLTESILSGWMGITALRFFLTQSTLSSWLFVLAHFGGWFTTDLCVLTALQGGIPLPIHERTTFAMAWFIREALALPIWAWAISGSTVEWREKRYKVLSDGRAAAI